MKRLIVCCDGTWQKLENPYPTNVLKMAQAIKRTDQGGIHQIVYYDEGLGSGDMVDRLGGGAFGWGIDEKIKDAYRFLCLNYTHGDQVYLFGFSRGAYTVRSLAGLIYNSGLLRRRYIRQAPVAYELYRSREQESTPGGSRAVAFRQQYGERIDITALCCWDSVGSLGVPEGVPLMSDLLNRRYRFYDTHINPRIQKAFHAVAVDEIREVFSLTPMRASPEREPQQVSQVWFPGHHECVGGGVQEVKGLSDVALAWMMDQVELLGLELDRSRVEDGISPAYTNPFDNRPKGVFKFTGIARRKIEEPFANLHQAVKQRWKEIEDYQPENLLPFEEELDSWSP